MGEENRTKAVDLLVGDSTWVVWVEDGDTVSTRTEKDDNEE